MKPAPSSLPMQWICSGLGWQSIPARPNSGRSATSVLLAKGGRAWMHAKCAVDSAPLDIIVAYETKKGFRQRRGGDPAKPEPFPMNPSDMFCPHRDCPSHGRLESARIVMHSQREHRYLCQVAAAPSSKEIARPTTACALGKRRPPCWPTAARSKPSWSPSASVSAP